MTTNTTDTTTTRRAVQPVLIGGQWLESASGETFEDFNPATGEKIGDVAAAGAEDIDRAVKAARKAVDDGPWPRMAARERKAILNRLAQLIRDRTEEIVRLDAIDVGKPIRDTRVDEIAAVTGMFEYFGALTENTFGQTIPVDPSLFNYTVRDPRGVVAIITPWNYPLAECTIQWAPALACGNAIVAKPAEQDPLGPLLLARLCLEAGIPEGVVNVVPGVGPTTGAALVNHPQVDCVAFTGSTKTGKAIMRAAAETMKHISFQLGGKAPMIVFKDANLAQAVNACLKGAFLHAGQVCECTTRLFLQESIHDEFLAELVTRTQRIQPADPLKESTSYGAMITPQHLSRVEQAVKEGIQNGANLRCGGRRPENPPHPGGNWFLPTIFTDVPRGSRMDCEEIFGPVLVVHKFREEAEAIEAANDSEYGLMSAVWTNNLQRAHRVARQLQAGTIAINNDTQIWTYNAPYGGYKQSGFGREFGTFSVEAFTQVKHVWLNLSETFQPWP